ncbi:ribosomal protein S18-alanine N-acetyltransferase [Agarivorans sp. MS3-6]|uniref:ribosomal protein S18-alanine N-acetyltransferase n=1 Tax=Agarivorans sp. TSD2052 TaxID=2937286 RepID=UPI00200F4EBF|nr:ribosomal protein S18-alanine N-acetyltransferase [Agarivorans sp. TSD2052]UPW17890.1 ribosomal protein S18-alanine N-acetyltransferase [Agarivorans sp. TSD2052]
MHSDPSPQISPLSVMDVPAMLNIEQQAHTHPWSRQLLSSNFGGLYRNVGLWQQNRLLAYIILRVVAGDAELINIAVDPEYQGQGLGKRLILEMLQLAKQQQWQQILLEVRQSNHVAQALYTNVGFIEIDRRKAYYPCSEQGREDALIMQLFCVD